MVSCRIVKWKARQDRLHPDNLVWLIGDDRGKAEEGMRELNFGEIHLIDTDGNPLN